MSSRSRSEPRFSIVVVAYNSRGTLPACLDSVEAAFAGAPGAAEILVVDNASRDGTGEWLRGRSGARAVLNAENLGFSRACNQAARLARGEFLLFLNPDALLTAGAVEGMAAAFADPRIGAVGPVSNYVAGLQRLDLHWPPDAGRLQDLPPGPGQPEAVAAALRKAHAGKFVETKLLIGFCLLMPRALYEAMGGMDENLFLGNDDLDLSWRLRLRGHKLAVAPGIFVFHAGQKSFQTESKTRVDRLVQESTDALFRKLARHYGGAERVPPPEELWGMGWFRPTEAARRGAPFSISSQAEREDAMNAIPWTFIVDISPGPEGAGAEAARETLDTLPMQGQCDVILINRGEVFAFTPPGGDQVRKLDLGPDFPATRALAMAADLARHARLLILPAGTRASAFFNARLESVDPGPGAFAPLLRSEEDGKSLPPAGFLAACSRDWLRVRCADSDFPGFESRWHIDGMDGKAPEGMPALSMRAEMHARLAQSRIAAADGLFLQYPETLRNSLQEADAVAFTGTAVAPVPTQGLGKGVDAKGRLADLEGQDFLVLRLTPDLVADLPARLRNIRERMPRLRRLSVVFDSAQALGKPPHPRGFEVPADLTQEGALAALRLAGFRPEAPVAYPGFPGRTETRAGWWQIDAAPRAREHRHEALVSIILLGFNQVEYTRKCVESIRRSVRQRHELILVDNGSQDGTWEYFQSVPGAKAIRNAENRGVSAGWNQGLRAARGDYLLILNNDTLLFPGTLENLVRLCESDPSIGIAGPRCNRVAAAQAVEDAAYGSAAEMETFASRWQSERDLAYAEYEWVKGVCMLIPRAAYEKIGLFDERFGKGNFEDDDYCLRARFHGFKTCIAHDSYLHHFGSVSFGQDGTDWNALMRENHRKFNEKWSRGIEALHDVQVSADPEPGEGDWLKQGREAYGRGDLAAARASFIRGLEKDPGDAAALAGLGALAFHAGEFRDSVLLSMRSLMREPGDRDTGINLLEALEALKGPVSEEEMAALRQRFPDNAAFGAVSEGPSWTPAPASPPASEWKAEVESLIQAGKFSEALDGVEKRMKSGQDSGACHNYMGVIAFHCGRPDEALGYFGRALDWNPTWDDALANACDAALACRNREALERRLASALRANPGHALALRMRGHLEREGDAVFAAGNLEALEKNAASVQNAETEFREGRVVEALRGFLDAVDHRPENPQALNGLGIIAFAQNRFQDAYGLFAEAVRLYSDDADILLNLWDAAKAARKEGSARPVLEAALRRNPSLSDVRAALESDLAADGGGIARRQAGA